MTVRKPRTVHAVGDSLARAEESAEESDPLSLVTIQPPVCVCAAGNSLESTCCWRNARDVRHMDLYIPNASMSRVWALLSFPTFRLNLRIATQADEDQPGAKIEIFG